jgi:hypothetical protein
MRSNGPGTHTSGVEVTNVSPNGLWLLLDGRELFASFRDFPWFADATIQQLVDVRRPSAHHLYWPALDVDLAVESLEHPERYPRISRVESRQPLKPMKVAEAPVKPRGAVRRARGDEDSS